MKGTSPSRASRAIAATGNEVPRWEVRRLINSPGKGATVRREAMRQLEDLPGWSNNVIGDLLSEVLRLDERIAQYDRHIGAIAKTSGVIVPAGARGVYLLDRWGSLCSLT